MPSSFQVDQCRVGPFCSISFAVLFLKYRKPFCTVGRVYERESCELVLRMCFSSTRESHLHFTSTLKTACKGPLSCLHLLQHLMSRSDSSAQQNAPPMHNEYL